LGKTKGKGYRKTTEQNELAHIAQKPCPAYGSAFAGIKEKAIEKLTDQDVIASHCAVGCTCFFAYKGS
jgi:hypothetical protein